MNIIKYPSQEAVNESVRRDAPLIAAIAHDGETAVVAPVDEAGEHSLMLALSGHTDTDIRNFFRISFNSISADWDFSCPPKYKAIADGSQRISAYYNDGLRKIPEFLVMFGYFSKLSIRNAPPDIWDF